MQEGLAMKQMKFISNIETLNITSAGSTIEKERKCMETLSETLDLDQRFFWHHVNER